MVQKWKLTIFAPSSAKKYYKIPNWLTDWLTDREIVSYLVNNDVFGWKMH